MQRDKSVFMEEFRFGLLQVREKSISRILEEKDKENVGN